SSSRSTLLAASSAATISGVRANELASSTRLRASSESRMFTTPHATARRSCCSTTAARCAGRGMTSATVIATAAASAIRKNQIFDRNTWASLLRGGRQCAGRDLGVDVGLALRGDVDGLVVALHPAVLVPDPHLVRAGWNVLDRELAAIVGVAAVLRVDDDDLEPQVRRVLVADRVDLADVG